MNNKSKYIVSYDKEFIVRREDVEVKNGYIIMDDMYILSTETPPTKKKELIKWFAETIKGRLKMKEFLIKDLWEDAKVVGNISAIHMGEANIELEKGIAEGLYPAPFHRYEITSEK